MNKRKHMTAKAMSIDPERKTMQVTISTRDVDRDGDILESKGAKLDEYRKNPVVLWAHDKKLPPIAKSVELMVGDDRIVSDIQFAETPFAKEIFSLYDGGFMNAWSVGFSAKEDGVEPLVDKDGRITGLHFREWELTEFSAVPVPANPNALVRAAKGWSDEKRKALEPLLSAIEEEDEEETYRLKYEDGEPVIEQLVEGEEPIRTEYVLKDTAFKKSVSERGIAGKIPTFFDFADDKESSFSIEFEAVKQKDNEITEAKILTVRASLPCFVKARSLAQDEPSREDGSEEDQDIRTSIEDDVARQRMLEEEELELQSLSARAAGL